eukprot:g18584.t1
MAGGNSILELKYHILNGRLTQAKKLLAATQLSLEDATDENGDTALHWLAQALAEPQNESSDQERCRDTQRSATLVEEFLVKARVDPQRTDLVGETPLMEAAAGGLEGIGRLLLEHRANPNAESSSGLTAMQLAEEHNEKEFIQLLKSPLAARAAQEAKQEDAEGRTANGTAEGAKTMEERQRLAEVRREKQAKKFEQTLFGQKLRPGLAHEKDAPGKPYPEYGTLHDID